MSSEPRILTFGCRLNAFESEVMRDHARAAGLDDVVIVNTCAVTAEAERQARQAIRRARRENPDAPIIVTGCAAQIDPARYAAMPEVDRVLGNEEKLRAESFLPGANAAVAVADIMTVRETATHLVEGFDGRARAFVQIQQGCDHRCTFCIIPFGRGNNRSAPIGTIVDQVHRLVEAGHREVVLTGVDITGYGADLPGRPRLGQMARRLLALVPELPRLRLTSVDCVEVADDEDLMRLIAEEERLMPHLHLSLQAGDDMILKRMKRRHSRDDAIEFCRRARELRPGIAFGADLIAGFPTETDEMFRRSLDLIEECDLSWLHVFPYSPREGTPAARMPQLPVALRKERAAQLRAVGDMAAKRFLDRQTGAEAMVLVERDDSGYSEHFAPVQLTGPAPEGALVRARIARRDGMKLVGEPVRRAA
ncbi:MAG: tRNA (N(6)-L-threonylcarbamoyladenosine(37)-C(2))-methylthiotransferase MtaB [Alphaproteobacteria bacterium]|nr:tRNA (N(6)-L-threonylcarbamoyladenosine(37)-C(2))-methylthiotransferase MtaB [Alphaproteobacteria bacterium]